MTSDERTMDVYGLASGQTGKTSKSSENEARTSVGFFLHVLQVLAQRELTKNHERWEKFPIRGETLAGECSSDLRISAPSKKSEEQKSIEQHHD